MPLPVFVEAHRAFPQCTLHPNGIEFERFGKCAEQSLGMLEAAFANLMKPTKALGDVAVAEATGKSGR